MKIDMMDFLKRKICKHKYRHYGSPIFPPHIKSCSNIFICSRCGWVKTVYGSYITEMNNI